MPPKKAAAKGKGKGKKDDQDQGPTPADIFSKFKKAYLAKCKNDGITPYKALLRDMEESAENGEFITQISIAQENFGVPSLTPLISALENYDNIKELRFWNADIGDAGIPILISHLQKSCVESLELIDNITPLGCTYLAKFFEEPGKTKLQSLTLDHSDIGDEGAIRLATGISLYPGLKNLSLNYCSIGASGGVAIAQLLLQPGSKSQIEVISLQGNICGPQTLAMFGQQLPHTTTLKTLNLSDNGIGDDEEPLELFRTGLVGNTSLTRILLDMNMIGDKAASQFLEVIGGPRQDITELHVTERISPSIYSEILKVLEANVVEAHAREQKNKPKKKKGGKKKKK